jgi:hypothetical protein
VCIYKNTPPPLGGEIDRFIGRTYEKGKDERKKWEDGKFM